MALERKRIGTDRRVCLIVSNVYQFVLRRLGAVEGLLDEDDAHWVLDPKFQRGAVWTLEQEQSWIEALLMDLPLPAIFLNRFPQGHPVYGFRDIVIDGQQRIRAIARFLRSEFSVRGEYYKDQTRGFQRDFRMSPLCPIVYCKFATERECAELYLKLLCAGTAHTPEEIQKARDFIQQSKEIGA